MVESQKKEGKQSRNEEVLVFFSIVAIFLVLYISGHSQGIQGRSDCCGLNAAPHVLMLKPKCDGVCVWGGAFGR